MTKNFVLLLAAVTSLASVTTAPEAPAKGAAVDHVYLALRTDGNPGTGTESDPFDASTAEKFDALMANFWRTHGGAYVNGIYVESTPLAISLGAGAFEAGARNSYGPNAGGFTGAQHWLGKGWTLRGAGMVETEIRNVNPNPGGIWMFNSNGGTWGGPESGEITIADLTLNPQKSVHEDWTEYEATITSADGTTTTAASIDPGWKIGMRIEITGENYNGPKGTWDGGGWKPVAAVSGDTFSWRSKNTLTGPVKVRRVGEWNATRINGAFNRVERVRVIDAGANSLAETWPLWVGGDDLVIDGCVIERCSGIMSGIGAFPGLNRTIRNCVVDGAGCAAVLAITAAENVEHCTIRNVTHGVYADTFALTTGLHIQDNTVENTAGAAILIRPNGHTKKILVSGNRVRGGPSEVGIWIDPLANWSGSEWQSRPGEKIWIDDVIVTDNDVGDKRIELAQTRGVTITNNIAAFGVFYRMPSPVNVSGNLTRAGEMPFGLADTIQRPGPQPPDPAPSSE